MNHFFQNGSDGDPDEVVEDLIKYCSAHTVQAETKVAQTSSADTKANANSDADADADAADESGVSGNVTFEAMMDFFATGGGQTEAKESAKANANAEANVDAKVSKCWG